MWQHWRIMQAVIIIYPLLTGLYAVCYDRKRRRFRKSLPLQVYAITHNICIMLLLPLQFLHSIRINTIHPNMFPSIVYIDMVLIVLRTGSIIFTLLTRCQHERQLCDIVSELSRLEKKFNSFKRRSSRMNTLMVAKIIVVCCLVLYSFITIACLSTKRLLLSSAAFYIVNCVFLLNLTSLHYFALLSHISNLLLQLNDQLFFMCEQVSNLPPIITALSRKLQTQLAADLCDLSAMHAQVAQLLVRLNATFKYKLLATYATYFVFNVSFCYVLLLLSTGFYPLGLSSLAANFVLFGICLVDLFLFLILSDRFTNCSAEVASMLRNFDELSSKDMLLVERSSELVSLQQLTCSYEVNVWGLFAMDRRTVFTIASSGLLYVIFLMQSDYSRKLNASFRN